MKKLVLLLVFGFSFVLAQGVYSSGYYHFDKNSVHVSVFKGNKPLKHDTTVEVTEILSSGIITISDSYKAYKGETLKTFLERRKKEDSILIANLLPQKTLQSEPQKAKKELNQTSTKFDYLKALLIIGGVAFLFSIILIRKR